jgi:hypothetical protein
MITLAVGTVEHLACKVTDVLPDPDALDSLIGKNPRFAVYDDDEAETLIMAEGPASIASGDDLIALCLIDADIPGIFPEEGEYRLFLRFDNSPETPRLGPFKFRIDD